MATRYQVQDGPWVLVAKQDFSSRVEGEVVSVTVEQSDMLDKRSGHRYVGAAYRVKCSVPSYGRAKTFLGESAWSDSARYANDLASKISPYALACFSF